jgi:membrane fusion protein, heavy metal efflux system
MKKNNIAYILGAIIVLLLSYIGYSKMQSKPKNTEGVATEAKHTEGEHEESNVKEVELNEAQFKNSNIELGSFAMKNLSEVINANGYTELPPQNQADVTAIVGGTIQAIKAIEGQYVKKGQILAILQSLSYNNMRLEKAKLVEQLEASQTNKGYLDLEYARQKELSDENVNAKKTFQKVASDLEFENKKIANLQNQIAILGQNLQVGGASESPILAITAPISGYISEVYIKIGSNAEVGKPLFSIVDNSQMHVDLLVYEKDLYKVKTGQNVRFILTNQNNSEVKGKIFSIGKSFENDTKSVAVHADIINEKQILISGMYVNALIDVGASSVQALPLDAIVKADGREFIFVLEEHEEGKKDEKVPDEKAGHAHDNGDKHEESEGKTYHFQRIEVKTGNAQLGFVQTIFLQPIEKDAKIVLKGAYYIQSHLLKSEGGGGHEH